MIRVRMLKNAAGPAGSYPIDSTPFLDEDTALAFLEVGAAEAFVPKTKREKMEVARQAPAVQAEVPRAAKARVETPAAEPPAGEPPASDPEELERQAMFDELVAGGTAEDEARALIWPKSGGDVVEDATRTPLETAVAPAQRPRGRR